MTNTDGSNDTTDAPSGEQSAPRKRVADRQITKDDKEEDEQKETTEPGHGFPKADAATMKQRRILKIKRPEKPVEMSEEEPSTTKEEEKKNPFASLSSSNTGGSVFGSAFGGGGFGAAASSGFGFGKNSAGGFGIKAPPGTPTSSTASIFGSTTAFSSQGLASTASSETSAFGGTNSESNAFGISSSKPEPPAVVLPEDVEIKNGEEEEDCIYQVRAKSMHLVDVLEDEEEDNAKEASASAPSVPPSSSLAPSARPDQNGTKATTVSKAMEEETVEDGKKPEASKEKEVDSSEEKSKQEGGGDSSEKQDGMSEDKSDDAKKAPAKPEIAVKPPAESKNAAVKNAKNGEKRHKQDWRELGIGPLRINKLEKGPSRVVQRRETAPGGAGTKLLLNVPLRKECRAERQGEKYVRLDTIEPSGHAIIYLLKVKTPVEAKELHDVLTKEINEATTNGN